MIFNSKNEKEIYYFSTTIDDKTSMDDFFLHDVKSILNYAKIDVGNILYITGLIDDDYIIKKSKLESKNRFKNIKSEYIDALKEFINSNSDNFIMLRIGYNDEDDDYSNTIYKNILVEVYTAAIESGFVDVTPTITNLEFSKTLVYRNNKSSKFLEINSRIEALDWVFGPNYSNYEIYNRLSD